MSASTAWAAGMVSILISAIVPPSGVLKRNPTLLTEMHGGANCDNDTDMICVSTDESVPTSEYFTSLLNIPERRAKRKSTMCKSNQTLRRNLGFPCPAK
jgi:hypothetical protein